jgi:hypothetical protein
VGELIEFYIPRDHKPKRKYVPEALRGKILKFFPEKDPTPTLSQRLHGILITDKRRFSDDKV